MNSIGYRAMMSPSAGRGLHDPRPMAWQDRAMRAMHSLTELEEPEAVRRWHESEARMRARYHREREARQGEAVLLRLPIDVMGRGMGYAEGSRGSAGPGSRSTTASSAA